MKTQTTPHQISVTLTTGVQLDRRELIYLRTMARHCIKTEMRGSAAAYRLDDMLRGMGIAAESDEPVYGIFE